MTKANRIREAIEKLPPMSGSTDKLFTPDAGRDQIPTLKLFTPDAQATWHLTEYDPEEGLAFGLCDLGMGFPELGYVSLVELEALRGGLGLPVEIDLYWTGNMADAKAAVNYPY